MDEQAAAAPAIPLAWNEIFWDPANPDATQNARLTKAFALLTATFPKRYLHMHVGKLKDKMQKRVDSYPTSLRVFLRTDESISVFMWVRRHAKLPPKAYCLSVGTAQGVADLEIYNRVRALCVSVKNEGGDMVMDFINQQDLPNDLTETNEAITVGNAFTRGVNAGEVVAQQPLGARACPWPSDLKRWNISL